MSLRVHGIIRIANDLELKHTQSNIPVLTFNGACDREFKDASGEKITDWYQLIAWRLTGENIAKYCKKGDRLYVEGRWETRSYDTDEGKKYVNEFKIDTFEFIEKAIKDDAPEYVKQGKVKLDDIPTPKPADSEDLPF